MAVNLELTRSRTGENRKVFISSANELLVKGVWFLGTFKREVCNSSRKGTSLILLWYFLTEEDKPQHSVGLKLAAPK